MFAKNKKKKPTLTEECPFERLGRIDERRRKVGPASLCSNTTDTTAEQKIDIKSASLTIHDPNEPPRKLFCCMYSIIKCPARAIVVVVVVV